MSKLMFDCLKASESPDGLEKYFSGRSANQYKQMISQADESLEILGRLREALQFEEFEDAARLFDLWIESISPSRFGGSVEAVQAVCNVGKVKTQVESLELEAQNV